MKQVYILFSVLFLCTYLFSKVPTTKDMQKNAPYDKATHAIHVQTVLKEAQTNVNAAIKNYNTGTIAHSISALENAVRQLQEALQLMQENQ